MSDNPLPQRFVPPFIIREAFNFGQFWERAQLGEFSLLLEYDKHYTRQEASQRHVTYCSRSQTVRYVDNSGDSIAVVHQIREPNGSLGASGKPDPKFLRLETEVLKVRR